MTKVPSEPNLPRMSEWCIRHVICYSVWVPFARRCPMPARIRLRDLTPDERHDLERLSRSRTTPARLVERARILLAAAGDRRVGEIADELHVSRPTISAWVRRFNEGGLACRGIDPWEDEIPE